MNIFILESNISLNQEVTHMLRHEGNKVTRCYSAEEAIDKFDEGNLYNLYILSLNDACSNKEKVCTYILQKDFNAKVIIIGGDFNIDTIKKVYSFGCIDYIKIPFHIEELKLKVRLYKQKTVVNIDNNTYFNQELMKLYKNGEECNLSSKELQLLHLLTMNQNEVVPFETLYHKLYSDNTCTYALRALIIRLRKYFENKQTIQSIPKVGYKLNSLR